MKKKIYLSGPITTDKDHYKEHFSKIEEYLTNLGFEVTNPAKDEYDDEIYEKGHTDKWTEEAWLDYMKRDIEIVSKHDIICLLIGWEKSLGGLMELATAKRFGMSLMVEGENMVYTEWGLYGMKIDPHSGHTIAKEIENA